jgi:Phospholipase_D-nuclease N-terminal
MPKRTWSDLTPQQKTGSIVGGLIQLALAAAAWTDLARRPATQVNGPKPLWALAIAVNFVGPISYFIWGRQRGAAGNRKRKR